MDYLYSLFRSRPNPSDTPSQPKQPPNGAEQRLLETNPPVYPRESLSSRFGPSSPPNPSNPNTQPQTVQPQSTSEPRPNKPPIIFAAGLAFSALSILVTRRSVTRRRLQYLALKNAPPPPSTRLPGTNIEITPPTPQPQVNAGLEAFEALGLATLNVLSFAVLATGSALWFFDIRSMDDARLKMRGGLGVDGTGRSEQEAEEDFEEWMARVLKRKEDKEEVEKMKTEREREKGWRERE